MVTEVMIENGIAATLLAFLCPSSTHGIFDGLTMTSMSGAWYHPLSPVESFLVGIILLQVHVLSYLRILPIDLNAYFKKGINYLERRKRRSVLVEPKEVLLLDESLKLIRKLDEYNCVLRSLCEFQILNNISSKVDGTNTKSSFNITEEISLTLNTLKSIRLIREKYGLENGKMIGSESEKILSVFEEAVLNGVSSRKCRSKYLDCPLSTEDFLFYINLVN